MNLKHLTLAAGLLSLSLPARALNFAVGDDVPAGDVVVEKGQTHEGDLAAKGAVTVRGIVTGDCAAFGGPLVVEGECRGEAASFGGPVKVSGRVGRDLASFGGPVDVSGRADREVTVFGGDLTVRSSGAIAGGVTLVGGHLNQETGAVIRGEVHDMDSRVLGALGPDIASAVSDAERSSSHHSGARRVLLPGFVAGLCLLPFLLVLFLPAQVEAVAVAASADFWRAVGIGLLIAMGVLPGLVAMAASVLGIPFIPVGLGLLAAALVMGMGAFFLLMTRRVCLNLGKPEPAVIKAVGLGGLATAAAFVLAGLLPGIGGILRMALFLTLCCGTTLGLGGVWLTRFGTRPAETR